MRWINGLDSHDRWKAKETRLSNWHKWYAWHPVTVGKLKDKRQIRVWLDYVERKGKYVYCIEGGWWVWEYREIK